MDMADAQRRPHPILVALAAIGTVVLLAVLLLLVGVGVAMKSFEKGISEISFSKGSSTSAAEEFYSNTPSKPFTAGIKLVGEIDSEMADTVLEKLEHAGENEKATAVLLEVDSPGGTVVPSQEMYDLIKEISQKKPVVAYVRDVAASGAYYTISSATKIVASRGSMIGSIGVLLSGIEYSEALAWLKVKPITLKTGKLKDAGSPNRPWSEDDKVYLQDMLEKTRLQFIDDVRFSRKLPDTSIVKMSDGRVVLGTEALELKLIDSLGGKKQALELIAELTKKAKPDEVFYLEESKKVPFFLEQFLNNSAKKIASKIFTPSVVRR
jgi:protease IV